MGYIKHDTIVVTTWEKSERFAPIHAKAKALLGETDAHPSLVSEIVGPHVNGQRSFFIAPDGSKEGWEPSTLADDARADFLAWLATDAHCWCDALVVRFGGDDAELSARVVKGQREDLDD